MINYDYISRAISFYRSNGFELIEVPWIVTEVYNEFTRPVDKRPITVQHPSYYGARLVASAEQSFLSVMSRLNFNKRYMAVTPCWRDENTEWNKPWFMKLELFVRGTRTYYPLQQLARQLFQHLASCHVTELKTPEGSDLIINGVEVGSYGYRNFDGGDYVYGTGIAEPRYSMVIK